MGEEGDSAMHKAVRAVYGNHEPESALDGLLTWLETQPPFIGDQHEQAALHRARADLAALRRERDDYAMMLRATGHSWASGDGKRVCFITIYNGSLDARRPHLAVPLQDDGTGLPVLTDAARDALRKALDPTGSP